MTRTSQQECRSILELKQRIEKFTVRRRKNMYIIPRPQQWYQKEGTFTLKYDRRIVLNSNCPPEVYEDAQMLQQDLEEYAGFCTTISCGIPENGDICLQLGEHMKEQEYTLLVQAHGICITGGSAVGIFYGIQTLRQIIEQCGCCIPYTIIVDQPKILHRGFYHDVTRGRIPTMDYLKKLVDRMAFYKLNQLQLYMEHTFLFRGFSEVWRDDTPLTAEDILELDAYCRKRHIELVPSIACFGHLYKVLRTKTYGELCEMPGMEKEPFGFVDRMRHHTLDVSNPESIQLVKALIDEFMPLFTSQYFNICADETFDLGKGKSAALAEEKGTQRLYLDFVKELCEYVVSKGKTPMFWGDIICEFPEAVQELPKETICLNWGYDADWPEDSTRKLSEAGARLYNCPGVSGWDQLVNQIRVSYENISRMCQYASNYHAEGLLNTDWGDCGHINHPDFSLPGMIYGAAFSWNLEIPEFEDINRQISRVAYGDETETLASVLARISESWKFTWRNMVDFLEQDGLKLAQMGNPTDRKALLDELEKLVKIEEPAVYQQAAQELETIQQELYAAVSHLPVGRRGKIRAYLIAVQGMILLQKIGAVLADFIALMEAQGKEPAEDQAVQSDINMENDIKRIPEHQETENAHREEQWNLAEDLEYWLYDYKKLWRSVSKEAELHRIEHVICQYADWLRVFDKICD
jgi:hexosaminidase